MALDTKDIQSLVDEDESGAALATVVVPFTGATAQADGAVGLVPAPVIAVRAKYLRGDGTWATPEGGEGYEPDGVTITLSNLDEEKAEQVLKALRNPVLW